MKLVNEGCAKMHPCTKLITSINNLRGLKWNIQVKYCFQEVNCVANTLANKAHDNALLVDSLTIF